MEQLTSDRRLLDALFQSAAEGILVVDTQGTIVLANPHCLHMFGYTQDELIGQSLELLVDDQVKGAHAKFREGFFLQPELRPMGIGRKLYGRTSAGTVFPIEVSLSHMEVEGERFAIGFIVDITKQKETEEALRKSEEFHRLAVEAAQVGTWDINVASGDCHMSSQMAFLMGLASGGQVVPKSQWIRIIYSEDRSALEAAINQSAAREKPLKIEFRIQREGGAIRWLYAQGNVSRQAPDNTLRLRGAAIDITERKTAVAALQKEKETAQRYLDIAASIILVLDNAGKVVLINRKGCQLLGYGEEEIVGKDWFERFLPGHDAERVREGFHHLMSDHRSSVEVFENAVVTKTGEERLIEWHNAIIADEQGTPVAALGSGVDITERRKAEREVTRALIEGQETERERIAQELHDGLGQSFTALKLNLNALERQLATADSVKPILDQLKAILHHSIQDMKAISRNLMPGVLRDYGLVKGLDYLCQMFNEINPVKIQLQVLRMDRPLNMTQSMGLYRIAQELINNALKHGEASAIQVQLIRHQNSVVLMVEDDGIGFDPKALPVRQSFGLNSMQARVKALHGVMLLDSHAGQGTSATVEIPIDY